MASGGAAFNLGKQRLRLKYPLRALNSALHLRRQSAILLSMSRAFILQFEEPVDGCLSESTSCGTQTLTKTYTEGQDPDHGWADANALPRLAIAAGTMTKTGQPLESSDLDAGFSDVRAIPRIVAATAGTQTATFVAAESSDRDRTDSSHLALPR